MTCSRRATPSAPSTEHRARSTGFVFQSFNLIPVFTAVENVELPLLLVGTIVPARRASGISPAIAVRVAD